MPSPPTRRNILITGASAGLGEGMARQFAARGRNLALCARRADRLDALRADLVAAHPSVTVAARTLDVDDHPQVFTVFHAFADQFGTLDRIIVNAGIGKGQPIGTGRFDANLATARTNFLGALAQCEAAMEIFRAQGHGHLVVISSVSALRGMKGNTTAYAATKAGLSNLAEGIRVDVAATPIAVTTVLPGYIRTELNAALTDAFMMVDLEPGVRAMVRAIEREPAEALVPRWPWAAVGPVLRRMPLRALVALAGRPPGRGGPRGGAGDGQRTSRKNARTSST